MGGFPWQEARFAEYRNTGPGAAINENRPQLTPAQARDLTREAYLTGTDNWQPWRYCR
jgi:pectinesterase